MNPIIDAEAIAKQTTEQIRSRIVELGADWHPAEKKADLMVRLAQLEGSPDVADKIRKQLADAGFAKDDRPVYKPTQQLSKAEIKKLLAPYVEKGLEYKVSPDGTTWMMRFDTGRVIKYGHEINPIVSRDSGSTTIPAKVLVQCAQLLVATRRAPKVAKNKADNQFVDNYDIDENSPDIESVA